MGREAMTCRHHYILNSDNKGQCKLCGRSRQFPSEPELRYIGLAEQKAIAKAKYLYNQEMKQVKAEMA